MREGLMRIWLKIAPWYFWTKDYEPKRCTVCGSRKFTIITDSVDCGHVSEYHVTCDDCETTLQYWAYGSYNPYSTVPETWRSLFKYLIKLK